MKEGRHVLHLSSNKRGIVRCSSFSYPSCVIVMFEGGEEDLVDANLLQEIEAPACSPVELEGKITSFLDNEKIPDLLGIEGKISSVQWIPYLDKFEILYTTKIGVASKKMRLETLYDIVSSLEEAHENI